MEERRRTVRVPWVTAVECEELDSGTLHPEAQLTDISLSGVLLYGVPMQPEGSRLRLRFTLPSLKMTVDAAVVHTTSGGGMGLSFLGLSPVHRVVIQELMKPESSDWMAPPREPADPQLGLWEASDPALIETRPLPVVAEGPDTPEAPPQPADLPSGSAADPVAEEAQAEAEEETPPPETAERETAERETAERETAELEIGERETWEREIGERETAETRAAADPAGGEPAEREDPEDVWPPPLPPLPPRPRPTLAASPGPTAASPSEPASDPVDSPVETPVAPGPPPLPEEAPEPERRASGPEAGSAAEPAPPPAPDAEALPAGSALTEPELLPAFPAASAAATPEPGEGVGSEAGSDAEDPERRPRVLVVDDHDRTRTMLRGMIEGRKRAFEVTEASDGEDCLRVVREQPPFDLIFLDVDMPRLDGFGTCRELRALGVRSPIIFLTGRSEIGDFREGREAGADTYIKKPIVLGTLRSMLGLFTSGSLRRR